MVLNWLMIIFVSFIFIGQVRRYIKYEMNKHSPEKILGSGIGIVLHILSLVYAIFFYSWK